MIGIFCYTESRKKIAFLILLMKIAILGAGLCGLASAAQLTRWIDQGLALEISIFDPLDIGNNASGIAAGLLHTYTGARAKLAYRGFEALEETLALAQQASKDCCQKTGMLRLALTKRQKEDFDICAKKANDVRAYDTSRVQKEFPSLQMKPGIYLERGYRVETTKYLKALWKLCYEKGVIWKKQQVSALKELAGYDACIVAAGAQTVFLPELSNLPLSPIKGQILSLQWPKSLPRLKCPINTRAYLIPDKERCLAGATFERNFPSESANVKDALEYLQPRIQELVPELGPLHVLDCQSGIRAVTKNRLPFAQRISEKTWVITGMGSKGLLYHSFFAKWIVNDVIDSLCKKISVG